LFGHNPIFALLGSNGAGKTTIAKILITLLKQDVGPKRSRTEAVADRSGPLVKRRKNNHE
jgi:ABC-type multidrug transport system ATPase subunit